MSTRLIAPFGAGTGDPVLCRRLAQIIAAARDRRDSLQTSVRPPVLLLSQESIRSGAFDGLLKCARSEGLDLLQACDITGVHTIKPPWISVLMSDLGPNLSWLPALMKILDDNRAGDEQQDQRCAVRTKGPYEH